MHPSVWVLLDVARNGQPLFPKLHRMEIFLSDPKVPTGFMCFLSPSLRNLTIGFDCQRAHGQDLQLQQTVIGAVIQVIPTHIPLLSKFSVDGNLPEIPAIYLESFTRFERLETLNLPMQSSGVVFDYAMLQLLSHNTRLRGLSAAITLRSVDRASALSFGDGFKAIADINLQGTREDLIRFFTTIRFEGLQKLVFNMSNTPTEESIQHALSSICACIPPSLRNVNVRFADRHIETTPSIAIADILAPLLTRTEITEVVVEFDAHIPDASDSDFSRLVAAWPRLRRFSLSYLKSYATGLSTYREVPTFTTVIAFAERCPALRTLDLFALDVEDTLDVRSVPALNHQALRSMEVGMLFGGEEVNLFDLAAIVDLVFPHLEVPHEATMAATFSTKHKWDWRAWHVTTVLVGAIRRRRTLAHGTAGGSSD